MLLASLDTNKAYVNKAGFRINLYDILYSDYTTNSNGELTSLGGDGTPRAICILPSGFANDGAARFMDLCYLDGGNSDVIIEYGICEYRWSIGGGGMDIASIEGCERDNLFRIHAFNSNTYVYNMPCICESATQDSNFVFADIQTLHCLDCPVGYIPY